MDSTRMIEIARRVEAAGERIVDVMQRIDHALTDLTAIEGYELEAEMIEAQQLAPVIALPLAADAPTSIAARRQAVQVRPQAQPLTVGAAATLAAGAALFIAGAVLVHRSRRR